MAISNNATKMTLRLSAIKTITMKTIAVVLLLITGLSCNKNRADSGNCNIVGQWEIRKEVGGIAAEITFPPGNGNVYEFSSNGTYQHFFNGAVDETGFYTLHSSSTPGQWTLVMISTYTRTISVTISSHELIFLKLYQCCDYPDSYFEKI